LCLALLGKGVSTDITKRRFHRIWLGGPTVAISTWSAVIAPILVSAASIGASGGTRT
jgi:hypothetical protein